MKMLRIAVILFAITLAVLFIRERHNAGTAAHTREHDRAVLEHHEMDDLSNRGFGAPLSAEVGAILVEDRFGSGGMISLDSLARRVQPERFMLSTSKSVVIRMTPNPESRYVDSLIERHSKETR